MSMSTLGGFLLLLAACGLSPAAALSAKKEVRFAIGSQGNFASMAAKREIENAIMPHHSPELKMPITGTVLTAGAILIANVEKDLVMSSRALEVESISLDRKIQAAAEKLEPGPPRDFLETLSLCVPCNTYARVGETNDGGYIMCTDGLDQGLVGAYSYGINGFDGWGMAVASEYNIPLNEYDCTNAQQPKVCNGCTVRFPGECILNHNSVPKDKFKTLTEQLEDAGNANAAERSLLLKIDVEGAEWSVFAEEPVENLKKFREIVVEYHHLDDLNKQQDLYLEAAKKIDSAGFGVTHLHGNNVVGLTNFGEFSIPAILEVTYIQKPSAGCAANVPYHITQDQQNIAGKPELPDAHLPAKV